MTAAAVVLAGGRSVRMGSAKAALPWHGSTLLRHVCGLVARGVDGPVLVVRAPGQPLPALPSSVEVLDDPSEGLGPLQGIAVGLAALQDRADVAFVCATDVPFLHPVFVRRVVRACVESNPPWDVVLPVARGHAQPLAAAYRPGLAPLAAKLVAADRLRPAFLFDECRVLRLDDAALLSDAALQAADPHLDSVVNLNGPDDYTAAHDRPAPQVMVECFGVLAADHGRGTRPFRAATVAGAAAAAGVPWDRHVLAAVNGEQTGRDGDLVLVSGDTVAFLSAAAGG
jgi:molybdenum cofactor guanylyltransferase